MGGESASRRCGARIQEALGIVAGAVDGSRRQARALDLQLDTSRAPQGAGDLVAVQLRLVAAVGTPLPPLAQDSRRMLRRQASVTPPLQAAALVVVLAVQTQPPQHRQRPVQRVHGLQRVRLAGKGPDHQRARQRPRLRREGAAGLGGLAAQQQSRDRPLRLRAALGIVVGAGPLDAHRGRDRVETQEVHLPAAAGSEPLEFDTAAGPRQEGGKGSARSGGRHVGSVAPQVPTGRDVTTTWTERQQACLTGFSERGVAGVPGLPRKRIHRNRSVWRPTATDPLPLAAVRSGRRSRPPARH